MPEKQQAVSIGTIAANETLNAAFKWLCHRRQKQQHNADIWDLRWRWPEEKIRIQQLIRQGEYRLSALDWFLGEEGDLIELYSARDALVLKALTLTLTPALLRHLSPSCSHVKGHGAASTVPCATSTCFV
jgi:hypothetical protein